jgi:hypothetical protein
MPCDKITQLKARAAKLGCTPDELAERALAGAKAGFYEKNKKDTAFLARAESKAKEICDALNRDKDCSCLYDSCFWPRSLQTCIVVAAILAAAFENGAEEVLLELSGVEMDSVEWICREGGLSYEEFVAEALASAHNGNIKPGEGEDDQDDSDWWKKA